MNPYALIALTGAVVALLFGLIVYLQDRSAYSNKLFLAVCLVIAYLSFDLFAYREAESANVAWFWMRAGSAWPFLQVTTFHYALVFTNYDGPLRSRIAMGAVYLSATGITAVGLFTNVMSNGPVERWWGWAPGIPDDSIPLYLIAAWTLAMVAATMGIGILQRRRSSNRRFRAQAKYLLLGYSLPIFTSMVSTLVLPLADVSAPDFSNPVFAVGVAFFVYGITRHQLFVLTPRTVSHEILETMSDAVLLVDTRRRIVSANSAATALIGLDRAAVVGRPLSRFLPGKTPVLASEAADESEQGDWVGELRDDDTVITTGSGRRVRVSLAVTALRSGDGDELGAVLVARDTTERNEMAARVERLEEQRRQQALKEAKEEERRRLAEELHDQTLMELTGLAIEIGLLERDAERESEEKQFKSLRARVHTTEAGLRDILKGLYPDVLTNLGLVAAIRSFLEGLATLPVSGDKPVSIRLRTRGFGQERPQEVAEITVYRLVQQSVFNAVRHGRPSVVKVVVAWEAGELSVEVEDDGVGFVPADMSRLRSAGRHGLANLYDRVEAVGGTIKIESSPGHGTAVAATIPTDRGRADPSQSEAGSFRIEPTR